VNMVKPTYEGFSYITDKVGNITLQSSYGAEKVVVGDVFIDHQVTVYGAIGGVLNYVYVAALIAVIVIGLRKKEERG
ncbi:MAG: hypothetical protein HUJ66_08675, partial [Oscillospiraceae bacterium]|nr:hypothetical protein [Oscillospiraceae bacterium]